MLDHSVQHHSYRVYVCVCAHACAYVRLYPHTFPFTHKHPLLQGEVV